MKVTPLEIRKKSFEKVFRGYDKDEVNAYLVSLSQAWEKVLDENKELTFKLDAAEKEIHKLREIENSLFKTLKTAEDTGASMIEQANKTAELHMKETQMKAEALMSESESKAKNILEEAEITAKEIVEDLQDEVKRLQDSHRKLQQQRDTLLREIKNIADGFLEQVAQARSESEEYTIEEPVKRSKNLGKANYSFQSSNNSGPEAKGTSKNVAVPAEESHKAEDQSDSVKPSQDKPAEGGSFFDNLE